MQLPFFTKKKPQSKPQSLVKEGFFAKWKRRLFWTIDRLFEAIVFVAAFRLIGPAATLAGFAVYLLLMGKRTVPERVGYGFLTAVVTLGLQIGYAHWH